MDGNPRVQGTGNSKPPFTVCDIEKSTMLIMKDLGDFSHGTSSLVHDMCIMRHDHSNRAANLVLHFRSTPDRVNQREST